MKIKIGDIITLSTKRRGMICCLSFYPNVALPYYEIDWLDMHVKNCKIDKMKCFPSQIIKVESTKAGAILFGEQ